MNVLMRLLRRNTGMPFVNEPFMKMGLSPFPQPLRQQQGAQETNNKTILKEWMRPNENLMSGF